MSINWYTTYYLFQETLVCSDGSRNSDWKSYMSTWGTSDVKRGNLAKHRQECWEKAKENVPGAQGIYFDYSSPYCRAIDNREPLLPWPTTFPDDQGKRTLCLLSPNTKGICLLNYALLYYIL